MAFNRVWGCSRSTGGEVSLLSGGEGNGGECHRRGEKREKCSENL